MTKLKLLLPALIAAAMLTAPVVARENHPNTRHLANSDSHLFLGALVK